ncbi:MAG TPA: response regulator transcription factor [Acidimicrobiales bacterium]|nr:response regulator transcription factor [Acidimicrobiales bacterium]
MSTTVLVVEDELKIRELLRSYLEREGWSVLTTGSGAEALTMIEGGAVDLVILDLGLPDVPGETVAAEVRRSSTTPILMLTARAAEEDRIRGLELGADDYVTKPFSPREVVLRARAIVRRASASGDAGSSRRFGDGALVIDEDRHEVHVSGERVELTPTEWGILTALAAVPGRVYSRLELLNRVRGYELSSERVVDSHVKNLRRKLEDDPQHPRIVETVLGAGYRLGLRHDQ